MAKAIKIKKSEPEINDANAPLESVSIPDIPAQAEGKTVTKTVKADVSISVKPKSDEVLFLERILHIQKNGGWGTHLNEIINERIKAIS